MKITKGLPGNTIYNYSGAIKIILIDVIVIAVLLAVPVISHKVSIPLYLLEPIRLSIIISILYSNKKNSVFMGAVIPFSSFIAASHPVFLKSILISFELIVFTYLLYYFLKNFRYSFISLLISILISKSLYYMIKYVLINKYFLQGELISTPIIIQIITTLFYSFIFSVLYDSKKKLIYSK